MRHVDTCCILHVCTVEKHLQKWIQSQNVLVFVLFKGVASTAVTCGCTTLSSTCGSEWPPSTRAAGGTRWPSSWARWVSLPLQPCTPSSHCPNTVQQTPDNCHCHIAPTNAKRHITPNQPYCCWCLMSFVWPVWTDHDKKVCRDKDLDIMMTHRRQWKKLHQHCNVKLRNFRQPWSGEPAGCPWRRVSDVSSKETHP